MARIKGRLRVWYDGGRLSHDFPVDIDWPPKYRHGEPRDAAEALDGGYVESWLVDNLTELSLEDGEVVA